MKKEERDPSTLPGFWDNCYLENEATWDLSAVSPPLKTYIDHLTGKNLSILIPGCGNAHEAEYLLKKGFENVTLIDFSSVVTEHLREKFKGKSIEIVNENFFDHKGNYDLILEQTFLSALHPSLREQYVKKCYELLNKNGRLAGVLFNKKYKEAEPPFIAGNREYRLLFSPYFTFVRFENCTSSVEPRRGNELCFEFQKKDKV